MKESLIVPASLSTELQIRMINCLVGCRFPPGSFEKRFVRDVKAQLSANVKPLTQKQVDCLTNIFHRYRKQIDKPYERICLELNLDAFSLEFDLLGDATIKPTTKKGKPIRTA